MDQAKKRMNVKKLPKCSLCSTTLTEEEKHNNPFPLCEIGDWKSRCCDECNETKVLPMRNRVRDCKSPKEAREMAVGLLSAPAPETVQVVTVPTNLHSIITRTMDSYYGYGSAYGSMVGHDSYNPWH
jgi:hypothetical protein